MPSCLKLNGLLIQLVKAAFYHLKSKFFYHAQDITDRFMDSSALIIIYYIYDGKSIVPTIIILLDLVLVL